jgi:hypothetical protein
MESITVQDLNDYNIGTMTLEIARKFENFEIKDFIYTNSVLVFPFLDNLTREEVCALLVEVYNSKVLLMRASTAIEESKEERSEL